MKQEQTEIFKPKKQATEETEYQEITLPDIKGTVRKSKQVLAKTMVCRVCGREDCHAAPRIPKKDYRRGDYSD